MAKFKGVRTEWSADKKSCRFHFDIGYPSMWYTVLRWPDGELDRFSLIKAAKLAMPCYDKYGNVAFGSRAPNGITFTQLQPTTGDVVFKHAST